MVETRSIYRREWNPATNSRDRGPPIVPQTIPTKEGAVEIFALVNYKRFLDSGLARRMIDEFYAKLPYVPPLLYLDVLTLSGGNFATGFPDGPLGGSEASQRAGRKAIIEYLRSKGTEVATEGSWTMHDIDGTYAWLHGQGISENDYSRLAGGFFIPYVEQTFGSMGGFNVSPIASTTAGLASVRAHYRALLAGAKSKKVMPSLATAHVCRRTQTDEFDIPGTGDPYRGDWADLVNNFYLITIQELDHIGKGGVRTTRNRPGTAHLRQLAFTPVAGGEKIAVEAAEFFPEGNVRREVAKNRDLMLETPLTAGFTVAREGKYRLSAELFSPDAAAINVYLGGPRGGDHRPAAENRKGLDHLRDGRGAVVAGKANRSHRRWAAVRPVDRRHAGRLDDALPGRRPARHQRRHDLRPGLRPHVARHVERAAQDLFLQLGRLLMRVDAPAAMGRHRPRRPVPAHAGRPRQG